MAKKISPHIEKFKEPGDDARLNRMIEEMKRGFDFLKAFDDNRVVTVFGSAQTPQTSKLYQQARELGNKLAQDGIVVATGGGPGTMEATNLGAFEAGGQSVGINIYLNNKERRNDYVTESIGFHYFFARKVILAHIAQAYVYFPGGFGTLDEFFEISTLVATNKIDEELPIVLFGKTTFWESLLGWKKFRVVSIKR
jgi:hypothetical protein